MLKVLVLFCYNAFLTRAGELLTELLHVRAFHALSVTKHYGFQTEHRPRPALSGHDYQAKLWFHRQ